MPVAASHSPLGLDTDTLSSLALRYLIHQFCTGSRLGGGNRTPVVSSQYLCKVLLPTVLFRWYWNRTPPMFYGFDESGNPGAWRECLDGTHHGTALGANPS